MSADAVSRWVARGLLVPDADAGTGERRHPRFRPDRVIAATAVRRVPLALADTAPKRRPKRPAVGAAVGCPR